MVFGARVIPYRLVQVCTYGDYARDGKRARETRKVLELGGKIPSLLLAQIMPYLPTLYANTHRDHQENRVMWTLKGTYQNRNDDQKIEKKHPDTRFN